MGKRMLFITVVLLIVSTAAFGGRTYGNSGGSQTQIAFTGIAQGSVAWGSGAGYSQFAGGNAYATQSLRTCGGSLTQTANPSLFGGGTGYTGCYGVVGGGWLGISATYQHQSLPQSRGFGGGWPVPAQAIK